MARVSAFEGLVWITESREIACGMAEPLASSLSLPRLVSASPYVTGGRRAPDTEDD